LAWAACVKVDHMVLDHRFNACTTTLLQSHLTSNVLVIEKELSVTAEAVYC